MKQTSPAESKDHLFLRSLAGDLEIDEQSVRNLLWKINAPASLTSFIQIADNIRQALRLAEAEIGFCLDNHEAKEWLVLLDHVVENSDALVQKVNAHFSLPARVLEGKTIHPLRGKGLIRHPLYTSLWNIHESDELRDLYRLLQFHILIAHAKLMEDKTELKQYEHYVEGSPILESLNSSTEHACRLLRDLSLMDRTDDFREVAEERNYQEVESKLSRISTALVLRPAAEFYEYFATLHNVQDSDIQTDCTKYFGLFFNRVYFVQETDNRGGGGGRGHHGRRSLHDGYINLSPTDSKQITWVSDDTDPDADWGSQHLIREHLEQSESSELDLDPSENETGEELYLSNYDDKRMRSMLSRILAAHGQVRHLMMANQLLRGRWSQMTVWEVSQLMLLCGNRFRQEESKENISEDDVVTLEAISLIMIMLWTGSLLERARKTSLTEFSAPNASELAYLIDKKEWRIIPYLPTYTTSPTPEQIELSRKKTKFVYLPDIFNVGYYLIKTAELKEGTGDSGQLFSRRVGTYRARIRDILKDMPEGARVSESGISRYLFHLIASEKSGDVADAIITTSTYHPLGQTSLHYTTPSADHIRDVYQTAIESVLANIYQEAYQKDPLEYELHPSLDGLYLGSRLCPRFESVVQLVDQLKSQVNEKPIDHSSAAYVRYHNVYTIYSSLMLGYATGFRAVKDPFVYGDEVDDKTGLACISDKDGPDYYNSRIVWMPDDVEQQLNNYSEHRAKVESDVTLRCPRKPGEVWPHMFLLGDDLSILAIRPKVAMPYLQEVFPMPLNVNRRFLRTELKERGCPVEIINCFMGHWSRGEEPWGKYSSLSFDDYVSTLKEYIPDILMELSWRPIKSLI